MTTPTIARLLAVSLLVLPAVSPRAQMPKDPCLLKPAEIQAVDTSAKIGNGSATTTPMGSVCIFNWGPRSRDWGEWGLTITVLDASKSWPGLSPEAIKQGVLTGLAAGTTASPIPGVGDAAAWHLNRRYPDIRESTVEAYVKAKGVHLSLTLHGGDGPNLKDALVALLKTAVARL